MQFIIIPCEKCGEEQGIIHMKMICKEIRFDWGFFSTLFYSLNAEIKSLTY